MSDASGCEHYSFTEETGPVCDYIVSGTEATGKLKQILTEAMKGHADDGASLIIAEIENAGILIHEKKTK